MKNHTDIEFARKAKLIPIMEIAKRIGLKEDDLEFYGKYKAKVSVKLLDKLNNNEDGKLILVTAINPTPAGEGKTTTTVGLGQAFGVLKKQCIITLREPSLGPLFGIKGGATGGGCAQVVPMEDINLHFTGDIHAVGAANNLLAAAIDNHIHQGNELDIDSKTITWKRVVDMNDRALRRIIVNSTGKLDGTHDYETGFEITAASEVMAILCLSTSYRELKEKLGNIVVAYDDKENPITAKDLKVSGAMAAILKDALNPNLVQTYGNTPAFVHGGPFANIAHGCSSSIATKLALKLADYVITEAGFGADLGGEKFFDIKCRIGDLKPDAVVIVATVRALKMHGGVSLKDLEQKNIKAVEIGLRNLEKHVQNLKKFNLPILVVINQFSEDTEEEIDIIETMCRCENVPILVSRVWDMCGAGGIEAAEKLIELIEDKTSNLRFLYESELSIREKIKKIAIEIYGADGVDFTEEAEMDIARISKNGFDNLPVCIAKTPLSLSDNPKLLGRPDGFKVNVRGLKVNAGAGFVVAYMGNIMTMPGLPERPAAEEIDIDEHGTIHGLF
jgi:formate--tetrahydrofolate ligase